MPHLQRDGVKVYYESHGQGTPIVFLHPFSTNGNIWYFQHYTFAQNYQCIIIDHRGHGRSDKPDEGYAMSEQAADVAAILEELKIEKAVLVGNSIGGMIALQFNLDFPERVLGNVIVSSGTNLAAGMPPEAGEAFQKDLNGAFSAMMEGAVSAKTKRDRPEILDLVKAKFMVDDNFPKHVFFASLGDPNGVFQWNISERLGDISKPTQIFAGKEDQATTVEVNRFLADNIPNATLKVIPDVGHFYQLEKSAEFNNDLRNFLKQVAA